MKRLLLVVLIGIATAIRPAHANSVDDASIKIATALQKIYVSVAPQDIALGDFVTLNIPTATFGDYLTEALGEALKAQPSTTIIEQKKVDGVLKNRRVVFNTDFNYTLLHDISYDIFQATQETPTSFCYGQIKESGDDIKISVKLIDATTGATIAATAQTFPSDETTDRLLGKPIRVRKPVTPDTVVIVKERIVEKYIDRIVEKPIEQPAERPVVKPVEMPAEKPVTQAGTIGFKIDGFTVNLKKCSFSGTDIVFEFVGTNTNDMTKTLRMDHAQVVDVEGNVLRCHEMSVGSHREGTYFRTDFLANVPVKVSLSFSGLSPKTTVVKALQVTAQGQEFVLRDIFVDRE